MSYQVLARKWRPKSFATLVGQEHVVRALTHALSEQRLHHAYLFTGTRGVGKTTIARILAKSLNCEVGISASPCGVCSACAEIDSGRFVDLLEVDAATNTRVDEMRQLLENAVYAPTRGRYKVYVIDEVHMLSNSAFNAMLKTLEEPPEHVKFILATTDPQKIPVTVLSRCLQFNLKQMQPAAISGHLSRILDSEAIPYEPGALNLLARSAAGSMRDALSLLDQAIAHGSGKVEEGQVRDMLGTVDLDYLFSLLDALLAGDAATLLGVADDMAGRSLSFDAALQELATLLTRIQVAQLAPQAIADDLPERARLLDLAARMDPEFVQLAYQIAVHGRQELALAPDDYAGFVMTVLRLHAFRPESGDAMPTPAANKASRTSPQARAPEAVYRAEPAALVAAPGERQAAPRAAVPTDTPVAAPAVTPAAAPAAAPRPLPTAAGDDDWHRLLPELKLSGMARELAQHCELRTVDATQVSLRLAPVHRHLQMKPAQDKLQQALSEHFGRPLVVRIELADTEGATPAANAQRAREERQEKAVAAIEQDGFVREVIEMFDAQLIESSIKPI
ncbi:DNA polymerase III subunit gamma/tau [Azospira restricta]|uniref:DNA polymerase III subunit gamma/tau n=1 Tax=Azospira restricta TaxID=404405 RepID=A0A974SS94_9RHOO|nr:DNA polymerase III subunit gamma/tau [Azospira restricta]QRJ65502.1 DNA polymerase III subunit gamma/tau [Azospira restricta]